MTRLLHLTARAKEALAAARRFHQTYERRLIRPDGPEAIATVRSLLTTMAGEDQLSDPQFRALYL